MKKIISTILALVLLSAMSATVFASSITDTDTGNSQEVLASFEEGNQTKTIISVDISWNQMSFTYKGASEPVWDAQAHQYVGEATEAGWAASDATITITNHSNTILQALISYTSETAYSGISMHFTDAAPYIGSAYTSEEEAGTPCAVTVKAIPDGALSSDTVDNTKIGVITVKVTADIDALTVIDEINNKTALYASQSTDNLVRGDVCFSSGTDTDGILTLADTATITCSTADKTDAEKNTAVNALITAYYGALDIVQ